MIETAIAEALPHSPDCPGDHAKCTCGATAKRNVLYVKVRAEMDKMTGGKVYLR